MKGVRFTKAMYPWSPGATALLPVPVADQMIREGAAVFYRFPDRPHAVDALAAKAPVVTPISTEAARPAQTYKTKRVA